MYVIDSHLHVHEASEKLREMLGNGFINDIITKFRLIAVDLH